MKKLFVLLFTVVIPHLLLAQEVNDDDYIVWESALPIPFEIRYIGYTPATKEFYYIKSATSIFVNEETGQRTGEIISSLHRTILIENDFHYLEALSTEPNAIYKFDRETETPIFFADAGGRTITDLYLDESDNRIYGPHDTGISVWDIDGNLIYSKEWATVDNEYASKVADIKFKCSDELMFIERQIEYRENPNDESTASFDTITAVYNKYDFSLERHYFDMNTIAFSDDCSLVAFRISKGEDVENVVVFDTEDMSEVAQFKFDDQLSTDMCFSRNNKFLFVAGTYFTVWDLETKEKHLQLLDDPTPPYVRRPLHKTSLAMDGDYVYTNIARTLYKLDIDRIASIEERSKDFHAFAYPSPAEDILTLEGIEEGHTIITLYDIEGREVKRLFSGQQAGTLELDVSGVQAGNYIIQIANGSKRNNIKVQIK